MKPTIYRYTFRNHTPLDEVEASLLLAILAAEGVHGEAQVRLDAGYFLDEKHRVLVVDARTDVGVTVAQIFTSFLLREFGDDAFSIERVPPKKPRDPARAGLNGAHR